MKLVGLITEYNPFHNGHQYHLEKALELTNADAAIVVMSGNYVQRGTPAIMPKHLRAQSALEAGAAVVLELPVCYAAGSAEYFALGAVSLLDRLGCVSTLCFGTESGDLVPLQKLAKILVNEPDDLRILLRKYLKSGISFPAARQKALLEFTGDASLVSSLEEPNNILGLEYLKALYRLDSRIVPYTVRRQGSGYHDAALRPSYSSASAIRRLLETSGQAFPDIQTFLKEQMPSACIRLLSEAYRSRYPVYADDFSLLLKYRLLTTDAKELSGFADISPELANRILKNRNRFVSFEQFCSLLKTRDCTYTRVSRALLHILLDIREKDMKEYAANGWHGYARILGFRRDCTDVLSVMKQAGSVPLLTKLTADSGLDDWAKHMLQRDIFASDLYESVVTDKFKTPFINEYKQPVIRI